jgi:hypothetical protein
LPKSKDSVPASILIISDTRDLFRGRKYTDK